MIALLPCGVFAGEHGSVTYTGGDGSSMEKAVVINGATEQTGVDAEYPYIGKHYPGFHPGEQSLMQEKGKMYDVLNFTTADGKKMTIYFNITAFFGK